MDHANGAHTVVEISYSYHHTSVKCDSEFVYELIGREGVIRYDRTAESFRMENGNGLQEFEFHPEKSFEGMYFRMGRRAKRAGRIADERRGWNPCCRNCGSRNR